MSFAESIQLFANNTNERVDKVVRSVILKIGNSLIQMSPVGNPEIWLYKDPKTGQYRKYLAYRDPPAGYVGGRFRANWQFGVGKPTAGIIESTDKSGAATRNKLNAAIAQITAGNVHYITNNLPYAIPLENGWSTQAPQGMARVTAARFQQMLKQSLRESK